MKKKLTIIIVSILAILVLSRLLLIQYQKSRIIRCLNEHISYIKTIGTELEETSLLDGDNAYLEQIYVLLVYAYNSYQEAISIAQSYQLTYASDPLILTIIKNFPSVVDLETSQAKEQLFNIENDLLHFSHYLNTHYPNGIKSYKENFYRTQEWITYKNKYMNYKDIHS